MTNGVDFFVKIGRNQKNMKDRPYWTYVYVPVYSTFVYRNICLVLMHEQETLQIWKIQIFRPISSKTVVPLRVFDNLGISNLNDEVIWGSFFPDPRPPELGSSFYYILGWLISDIEHRDENPGMTFHESSWLVKIGILLLAYDIIPITTG